MPQSRALVAQNTPGVALAEYFSKYLDKFSKRLDGWRRLCGAYGVRKLRKILQISQSQFAALLEPFSGKHYNACTISMWEMPERKRRLPSRYWQKRFPQSGVFDAISKLIVALIEWSSRGNFTARVTGKRKWRVTLKRI